MPNAAPSADDFIDDIFTAASSPQRKISVANARNGILLSGVTMRKRGIFYRDAAELTIYQKFQHHEKYVS